MVPPSSRRLLLTLTVLGHLHVFTPAVAQEPDPLAPLVAEALDANLAVEEARLAERRGAAEAREAIGRWLPRVTLESRVSEVDGVQDLGDLINPAYAALNEMTGSSAFPTDVSLALPRQHDTHVRVTQPLVAEGLRAGVSAARARHDAQRETLGAVARGIAAAVQIAYLETASARRVVEVHEAALALVIENERVARRLLDAGSATPEAVLRARADRAEVEQALAEAQHRHAAAARELNRILKRPDDAPVVVLPDEAFDVPLELDADAAVAHALAHREELAAADAAVRAAGSVRRAATSRYLPDVSFAFDYGFTGAEPAFRDDEDYWVASLVAQWELLDFGRPAARDAATHEADRAKVAREDLADRIRLEARAAWEAARTARDAVATAEVRLDASRRTFELVRRRFEDGAASPLELTDARTALTSAELNRTLTAYRYATRRVDLERAAALRDVAPPSRSQP